MNEQILRIDTASLPSLVCVQDMCQPIPTDALLRRKHILETIEAVLNTCSLTLLDITCIEVTPGDTSFTQIRTTVAVANALSQSLNIPVRYVGMRSQKMVLPLYPCEPHITRKT